MTPTHDNNSSLHREALRYTEDQMRILLNLRDMVKEEVKREVARQLEKYIK